MIHQDDNDEDWEGGAGGLIIGLTAIVVVLAAAVMGVWLYVRLT